MGVAALKDLDIAIWALALITRRSPDLEGILGSQGPLSNPDSAAESPENQENLSLTLS